MATSIATSLRHVRLEPVHFTHAGGAIEVQQFIVVSMVRLINFFVQGWHTTFRSLSN